MANDRNKKNSNNNASNETAAEIGKLLIMGLAALAVI